MASKKALEVMVAAVIASMSPPSFDTFSLSLPGFLPITLLLLSPLPASAFIPKSLSKKGYHTPTGTGEERRGISENSG